MSEGQLLEFVRDVFPRGVRGSIWQAPSGERLARAIAGAFEPTANDICSLHDRIAPFNAPRQMLEQWFVALYPDCLTIAADTEELRTQVLVALGKNVGSSAGFIAAMEDAFPSIEVEDQVPVAILPLELPGLVEATGAITQIWHAPLLHNVDQILCLYDVYAPATSRPWLVTPIAELIQLGPSTLAGDIYLHWREMRPASSELFLSVTTLPAPGSVVDSVSVFVVPGPVTRSIDTLLPSTGPGDDMAGLRVSAFFDSPLGVLVDTFFIEP